MLKQLHKTTMTKYPHQNCYFSVVVMSWCLDSLGKWCHYYLTSCPVLSWASHQLLKNVLVSVVLLFACLWSPLFFLHHFSFQPLRCVTSKYTESLLWNKHFIVLEAFLPKLVILSGVLYLLSQVVPWFPQHVILFTLVLLSYSYIISQKGLCGL